MSDYPPIRKAVFPVAGLGTRFLPVTKSIPKEMLPIVDKPLIQYAVEEAIDAGIERLIFVTNRNKLAILEHFKADAELQSTLLAQGKKDLAKCVSDILPGGVQIQHVFQDRALGLGHAVWCARELVGDEPFAVILADDLIRSPVRGCLQQMVEVYDATGAAVVGVEEIPAARTDRYGIVSVAVDANGRNHIQEIVEKPAPWDAPSNLGVVGRYILPSKIFTLLEAVRAGVGGEIQLTDAIAALLPSQPVLAHAFSGVRYDCGSRQGFIRATVDYAFEHAELRADLLAHFKKARRR
jgi:UTP--glucose-1-phosphate uridylyltransferase